MPNIPILVFVYDRFEHFKNCIQSLQKCPEAKFTELYISSDFYRNEIEKNNVLKVRKYINSIKGFKKVNSILFEKNVGIDFASSFSIKKVFEKYDSVILTEDDNVFSPLFLEYMNTMSASYLSNDKVFAVSGFSPNVFGLNYQHVDNFLYVSQACAVWGFILSREKYFSLMRFITDINFYENLRKDLKNKSFIKKLNKISLAYHPHLLSCILTKESPAFDFLIAYYCLKNNLSNIHYTKTFVKNFGHDGSGLRNRRNEFYLNRMSEIQFSESLPKFVEFPQLKLRNDFVGHYSGNKFFYHIKLISIRFGLFNYLKGFKKNFDLWIK